MTNWPLRLSLPLGLHWPANAPSLPPSFESRNDSTDWPRTSLAIVRHSCWKLCQPRLCRSYTALSVRTRSILVHTSRETNSNNLVSEIARPDERLGRIGEALRAAPEVVRHSGLPLTLLYVDRDEGHWP